jgi:uncharacterized membrane protein YbhN (UPF0104 family)
MSLIAPADVLLPEALADVMPRARRLPKRWMSWSTGLFLGVSAIGAFAHRRLVGAAWAEARSIPARWWAVLVALVVAHRLALVVQQWAAVKHVSFGRMTLAAEANLGASNAVVGGSAIGTALRVAMWRSWGVDPLGAAVALFVTALCPSFALWLLAGVHTWPNLLTGHADRVDTIIGVGSIGFLLVPLIFWTFALTRPGFAAWISRRLQGVVLRVCGRIAPIRRIVLAHPIPELSEDFRTRSLAVFRRRGLLILTGAVVSQLLLALLVVASLHAVGVGSSLDAFAVVRAFALVRVFSSFVPIPGGIGVMELGIVSALISAGSTRPQAVAALAVYRGLTFFLPIVTGTLGALAWRRRQAVTVDRR